MRHLLLASAALFAISCASDTDGAVAPELGSSGKADAADHVELRAPLAFETPRDDAFVEDLEFQGFPLTVRAGATLTLELTHAGSSSKLDATMFVYGPHTDEEGWGTEAVAFDDDSGWGRLPRLRDLQLDEAGQYLVVIGTHDARGRGHYRLRATCSEGECAPPPSCIFGAFTGEIFDGLTRLTVVSRTTLHSAEGLDAITAAQIVDAIHESIHDDVTTAAEAFEAADQGEINVIELHDTVSGADYTFIEYGAGDNSFGRIFDAGTTHPVATDHDTDVEDCTVLG